MRRRSARATRSSGTATAAPPQGKVLKKITTETEAGGRKVKASKDEPQYLVESESGSGTAVHKPEARCAVAE